MSDLSQEAADKIHWWHTMRLPNGVVTKGHHDPSTAFPTLHMPASLAGLRCADVGAWDGAFSFEMARRGARQVTALDEHVWEDYDTEMHHGSPTGKQGFDFANEAYGHPVNSQIIDVLDLKYAAENEEFGDTNFDLVLFIGVLYHMRHPLLALENVAAIVNPGGLCIIETHLDGLGYDKPAIMFYEGRELNNDPTNWCGPNPLAVCAMARAAGFASCHLVWNSGSRGVFHAQKAL